MGYMEYVKQLIYIKFTSNWTTCCSESASIEIFCTCTTFLDIDVQTMQILYDPGKQFVILNVATRLTPSSSLQDNHQHQSLK